MSLWTRASRVCGWVFVVGRRAREHHRLWGLMSRCVPLLDPLLDWPAGVRRIFVDVDGIPATPSEGVLVRKAPGMFSHVFRGAAL